MHWIKLDEIADLPQINGTERAIGEAKVLDQPYASICRLRPPNAQIMLLWREGE